VLWFRLRALIAYHEKYRQYDLGPGHPYRGDRFVNAMRLFQEKGLFEREGVELLRPEPATEEDLLTVHDEEYVRLIFRLSERGIPYDVETPCSPTILEAALLITGGSLAICDAVYEGRADRGVAIGGGFHHAGRNYGGGFCLFNDVAILVERARRHGAKRVMVIDHDVHAGNGTSDIYYSDPDVLYVGLHQDPRTLYPGRGFVEEIGEGDGRGFNVNIPLPPGTDDQSYLYALNEIVPPLAREFKPDFIISNGGSDPHFADMLGNLQITAKGFHKITSTIAKLAEELCNGRYILMPGSGYNPQVLPICWYALTAGALGISDVDIKDPTTPPPTKPWIREEVQKIVDRLKKLLSPYWNCFK